MTDNLTQTERSAMMRRIRGSHTRPEMTVRRWLHAQGYRYRLHRRDLPGRPDIILQKHRTVILVHGCFWHRHEGCRLAYTPKSNVSRWQGKFAENVARDARNVGALQQLGWNVITIWECEVRNGSFRAKLQDAGFRPRQNATT